ncbi:hypothetical protein A1O1_07649 [Capronia coronata CBS 617.96]|uniref:Uncharacterized protein n=1 Tax=Capronia coronata CBS 617.96 TaxID=1182541 RepID=W9XW59_9EURO|nr:uncharacterized protein A1O1_07649 [Capronia coronata CBS 617.96]EXJ81585.1 hypothetical protein A1O1_07649 [Capronia coronata CBS 617.96]
MPAPLPPRLSHKPVLRLHLDDVTHAAAQIACSSLDSGLYLERAIEHVVNHLYDHHGASKIPKVRSVTVVLRSMGGVAYTTGLPLDDLHKEIHLSLDYVRSVHSANPSRIRLEIAGVVTHEMVHCFQNNCQGTAPGGLIEGIADFVRLKAGLAPPHWNGTPENRGKKWDEGYQKTAWFLEWLEERHGPGSISRMNQTMAMGPYDENKFWHSLFGQSVEELWSQYKATWMAHDQDDSSGYYAREPSAAGSEAEMVNLNEQEKEEAIKEERRVQEFFA